MKTEFKGLKFQRAFYAFLRICFGWLICLIKNYHFEPCKINAKPVLVLMNHNSDFDPFYLCIGTKLHAKFVASANILEGFSGRIIRTLVDPIPRKKGSSADDTVKLIIKNLRAGINVAMFPEGNKSWDGETCFISKRTAALLKEAECGLVTYRVEGDYLKSPRWSDLERRGPLHGHLIGEYSAEELKKMTVDEIYQIICRDLYVNAFEEQRVRMDKYSAKALSKGISGVLYICPKCRSIGKIKSDEKGFYCSCGLNGKLNEYGFLDGEGFDFDNTLEWNRFQKKYLKDNAETLCSTPAILCEDVGCTLASISDTEGVLFDNCDVKITNLSIIAVREDEQLEFPLSDISRISTFRNRTVYFTCGNNYYRMKFREGISGLKYDALWRTLTGREYV